MNEIRTYVKQIGNIDEGHVSARYHATVSMYNEHGSLIQVHVEALSARNAIWYLERKIQAHLNLGGTI